MAFGELMSHIATTNYQFCAGLKDSQPPALPSPKDKDATVKFLSDSFENCSGVIQNLTEPQLNQPHDSPDGRMPGPKFFSPCTFTGPIIAARPNFIFATKAFALLPIEFILGATF
jgi:hypothetical protein